MDTNTNTAIQTTVRLLRDEHARVSTAIRVVEDFVNNPPSKAIAAANAALKAVGAKPAPARKGAVWTDDMRKAQSERIKTALAAKRAAAS